MVEKRTQEIRNELMDKYARKIQNDYEENFGRELDINFARLIRDRLESVYRTHKGNSFTISHLIDNIPPNMMKKIMTLSIIKFKQMIIDMGYLDSRKDKLRLTKKALKITKDYVQKLDELNQKDKKISAKKWNIVTEGD